MKTVTGGAFAPTAKKKTDTAPIWAKEVRKVLRLFSDVSNMLVQVTDGAVFVSDGYALVRVTGSVADAFRELCAANGMPTGGSFAGRRSGDPVTLWHGSTVPDMAALFEKDYLSYEVATCERVAAVDAETYVDGLVRCAAGDTVAILDAARAVRLGAAGAMVKGAYAPVRLTNANGDVFALLMPLRGVAVAEEVPVA